MEVVINNRKSILFLWLLLLASLAVFVWLNFPSPLKIQGDGVFYYAWLHSVFWDHDLDFSNQLAHFADDDYFSRKFTSENIRTGTGLTPNAYPFGLALMWLPFIFLAHILTNIFYFIRHNFFITDGYSYFYVLAVSFAGWFYGAAGLIVVWRILKKFFSERAALLSVLALWLATPWLYYQLFEPTMSHMASLFLASFWLYLLVQIWQGRRVNKLVFMAVIFLLIAVRWQNSLFVILFLPLIGRLSAPQVPVSFQDFVWPSLNSGRWKAAVKDLMILALPLGAIAWLQMSAWKIIYGQYLLVPQGYTFVRPEFHGLYTLFSSDRGLLLWSPVIVLTMVGFVWLWRKSKFWTAVVLVAFIFQWVINSSLNDLGGGDAFGGRRFIETLPFLALPLAALLDWLKKYFWLLAAVIIILIFWNLLLIQNYRWGNIPRAGEFGLIEVIGAIDYRVRDN
ncbi:MAG TPA: hypothetical protein PK085_02460 [bacterium]|nr:hypothetical protein [bacterium]